MKVIAVLSMLVAFSVSAGVRSGAFMINPKSEVEIISSNAYNYQTILFTKNNKTQIGVYKNFEPQSIRTVRIRAQEDGAASSSVRYLKSKQGSIFYYQLEDGIKFFSTQGGVLFLVTQSATIVDPTQINLVAKNQKPIKGKAK